MTDRLTEIKERVVQTNDSCISHYSATALEDIEHLIKRLEDAESKIDSLFKAIAHGDTRHRIWLKNAINEHFHRWKK